MKTLTVTLKQHTPLIHFQYDQYGATLRASEVKPKLDKYLLKKLNDDPDIGKESLPYCKEGTHIGDIKGIAFEYIYNKKKKRWMNVQNKSFLYRMRIVAEDKNRVNLRMNRSDFPFVLCNMDKERDEMIQFSYYKEIELRIMAHDEMLLHNINKYLDEFFAVTNFGCRQNKGFGSFYRKDCDVLDFEKNILKNYPTTWRKTVADYERNLNGYNELFKQLDRNYKELKAGLPGRKPKKSCLSLYFKDFIGEKEIIKDCILNNTGLGVKLNKALYIRSCLGLTDGVKLNDEMEIIVKHLSENETDKIERYQSPITFKIFDNYIFILANNTFDFIKDETFEFSFVDSDRNQVREAVELNTPASFDLYAFLNKNILKMGYTLIR